MQTHIQDRPRRGAAFVRGAALVALLASSGCYKATFVEDASSVKRKPNHEAWTHHYVFGLVGNEKVDANKWCPNGTAAVRTSGTFETGVVTIVTLGIYSPRKVYVTCTDGRTAQNGKVQS